MSAQSTLCVMCLNYYDLITVGGKVALKLYTSYKIYM